MSSRFGPSRWRLAVAVFVACALGPARSEPTEATPSPDTTTITGTVGVFAAASLTAAFGDLARAFEASHPAARVQANFAASSTLVQQIEQGAPADVFASANEEQIRRLMEGGMLAGAPVRFARNLLAIAVEKGNPHRIRALADLAEPGLVVVLAAPAVPAGQYALEAFARAGVEPPAGSRELDVKGVLSRVALGEADAGVVYVTDVRTAGDTVTGVTIPDAENVVAHYPIAAVRAAPNPAGARAFVAFVLSPDARAVLVRHGFLPP
jgi:molybdate transport system substrate-binding protein